MCKSRTIKKSTSKNNKEDKSSGCYANKRQTIESQTNVTVVKDEGYQWLWLKIKALLLDANHDKWLWETIATGFGKCCIWLLKRSKLFNWILQISGWNMNYRNIWLTTQLKEKIGHQGKIPGHWCKPMGCQKSSVRCKDVI